MGFSCRLSRPSKSKRKLIHPIHSPDTHLKLDLMSDVQQGASGCLACTGRLDLRMWLVCAGHGDVHPKGEAS